MQKYLEKIVSVVENAPLTFITWAISFLSLIAGRLLVESWLGNFKTASGLFFFYEFTHTFLFFLLAYILFVLFFKKIIKITLEKSLNILLLGYLVILTPPIFDFIISGGKGFWSFYKFDSLQGLAIRFATFFGDKPEIGITYGVRIEVALAVIFFFFYSFIKTRKIFVSLATGFLSYAIFFILGTFPSWIAIAIQGFSKGFLNINDLDVAQMFLTPAKIFSRDIPDMMSALNIKMSIIYSLVLTFVILIALFFSFRKKFLAFLANARFPQLIYHAGLLSVGLGLSIKFSRIDWYVNFFNILSFFLMIEAVFLAWLASVVANDLVDKKIDRETNNQRPLTQNIFSEKEYAAIGIVLFLASILFAAIVSFKAALFLLAYQALAWIYSSWPLRLKRFPLIATFASAMASLMILFAGFSLGSPTESIQELPFSIVIMIAISFTLSLPIKDFKDIEGDKKDSVFTIPVIFGEQWGKIIVGAGIFFSFLLSVVLLNESRLFWWALLFGGASFWVVAQMKKPAMEKSWLHPHTNSINKRSQENYTLLNSKIQNTFGKIISIIGVGVNYRNIFWWMLGIVSGYGIILVKVIFL